MNDMASARLGFRLTAMEVLGLADRPDPAQAVSFWDLVNWLPPGSRPSWKRGIWA